MPDDKNIIEPIDADFDEVAKAIVSPAPLKSFNNIEIGSEMAVSPAPPIQLPLDLGIEVEKVIGGVEMGVLQNGLPYLTQTGLAAVSGAARATVFEITQEWQKSFETGIIPKGRVAFFRDYLASNGYDEPRLYMEIMRNGTPYYAYPDVVCMAFVEYFAFEAQKKNEIALANFRNFARFGLQQFIYKALDYTPPDKWQYYNARVSILRDSVPFGYFSMFKESAGLTADLIRAGLTVNEHTIPDGSVGGTWANYWKANNFDEKYGARIKYAHYFPPEFPQSASNPQEANAYPNEAWPEFQRWFKTIYLPTKYPAYILKKAHLLPGGIDEAKQLAGMYAAPEIEGN
jgi:hypothetical protein